MIEITGKTKLTGLLGQPVAHSISPAMHNKSFELNHLDYVYLAFDVAPDQLSHAVSFLKETGCVGYNLTMPHKRAIIPYLDELTPAARLAGAVNTVLLRDDGTLLGHTTDGIGFWRSQNEIGYNHIGQTVTLLGTGGAATAIMVQGALDGVKKINVFKRKNSTFEEAQKMIETIRSNTDCELQLLDLANLRLLRECIEESSILINATNVGMEPDIENSIIHDSSLFSSHLLVSDIIYHPRNTKFLQLAQSQGCMTSNGLYMLLYQGAASFKMWTGKEMPTETIKELYFQ
ncbi:shikimate dehydrogenase [Eubacterium oxidoreducens]|uniref:Shikimate dehydrogenase (NADP(+)) n=1 Tax=Eubacterium oxidoreducens TaxID=1732 RepID=A0A1G6AJJ5_EUBOX|nr:shikimate dehydrogenase [Eubacterium oxidoreducens]SDB08581.1 shikimate dehydrogenase [Eubacterium oxidoreducens]